ncbi:hypothetical protein BaRGS_00014854 [Batillaria attramentaria]|uniref:Uncharacterized protein n=1 Tax=Batillaria attramentaria TaxID=370345 RepID=A0ABD0L3Q8_9CAEN
MFGLVPARPINYARHSLSGTYLLTFLLDQWQKFQTRGQCCWRRSSRAPVGLYEAQSKARVFLCETGMAPCLTVTGKVTLNSYTEGVVKSERKEHKQRGCTESSDRKPGDGGEKISFREILAELLLAIIKHNP